MRFLGGGYAFAHSSIICFYYTTIFFFCQVFYTTFLELFLFFSPLPEGTLCRPKVPFHPPRALARLRRSNSCFKQKGNSHYFPFAQLLHISEMFSSLFFFSVAGLLGLGFTSFLVVFFITFGKVLAFLAAA